MKNVIYKIVLPIFLWSIGYSTLDEYLTEVEKRHDAGLGIKNE